MDKQKILHPKNIGAYTLILSTTFLLNAVSAQNVVADENSSTATIIQPLKAENANDLSKEISTTVNHVEEKNTDLFASDKFFITTSFVVEFCSLTEATEFSIFSCEVSVFFSST